MVVNSCTWPRSWTSLQQDTGRGRASWRDIVVCTAQQDVGWLREKDTAGTRVNEIPAILIVEMPELSADHGMSSKKAFNCLVRRRDVQNSGEALELDIQEPERGPEKVVVMMR